jgi:hypothetical protein
VLLNWFRTGCDYKFPQIVTHWQNECQTNANNKNICMYTAKRRMKCSALHCVLHTSDQQARSLDTHYHCSAFSDVIKRIPLLLARIRGFTWFRLWDNSGRISCRLLAESMTAPTVQTCRMTRGKFYQLCLLQKMRRTGSIKRQYNFGQKGNVVHHSAQNLCLLFCCLKTQKLRHIKYNFVFSSVLVWNLVSDITRST